MKMYSESVRSLACSPDGKTLAWISDNKACKLSKINSKQSTVLLSEQNHIEGSVTWSPDGQTIALCKADTIQIWDVKAGRQTTIIEGHTERVTCTSFSFDGRLLASSSDDGTISIWRSDTWERVAILEEQISNVVDGYLTFHPKSPVLATLGNTDKVICLWDLDFASILDDNPATPTIHYTNAKIVLVGDTGVGKSGLSLVLTGHPFAPTESTHGRHVWTFGSQEVEFSAGRTEIRETLLWDLAGQPGYRLIHQLHLNEVAVALIVFDARSETDPFAGVRHWERALRLAQRIQSNAALPMKKFLIAARIDRGGRGVSLTRVESLVSELEFDGFFETSAKEGKGIETLVNAMQKAIDWDVLPKVSSPDLFQQIKNFLVAEKETGRLLSSVIDLYRTFLKLGYLYAKDEKMDAQFETCIRLVEARDLIKRLSFGNLVLLQPELLDAYASALVNAVKDEPDGLGSILEEKVLSGDFFMSEEERLKDKEQEKLLLIAMVEDLLRREIALREQGIDGPYLIFPSQSTRENLDLPDPEGKAVIFRFEGPVLNIYTTLAVRLSHSDFFKKNELWKNAATYIATAGGICGIFLRNSGEGQGELTLFFDKATSKETRFHFEEYVNAHLQKRAIPESIRMRRIFVCSGCEFLVTEQLVKLRLARGFNWVDCPACGNRISLLNLEERLQKVSSSLVSEMDRAANAQRDREAAKSILQGKIETNDFDIFLCHNSNDKDQAKKIGEHLKEQGLLPWLDEWELRPGLPWQRLLEQQISQIKSAAVFVGKDGVGPWQHMELEAFLREFVDRGCPVIPVLLSNVPQEPELPIFLKNMTWVDFRKPTPDPMKQLIWGITGKHASLS
jgi:small GTP-binding protein